MTKLFFSFGFAHYLARGIQWNGSLARKSFQISYKLLSESNLTVVMYFPELALDIQKQFQNFRCSHDVDVA